MSSNQSHKKTASRRKWPWILIGSLLLLVVAVRVSLTTKPVQNFVKGQILSVANTQLNAELRIGDIKGDLWKEITISNISLNDHGQTVASIDSIYTAYDVLSYFSEAFEVSEVLISQPFLHIEQQDSTWNTASWLKKTEADTAAGEPFAITIGNLKINEGRVDARLESFSKDSSFSITKISLDSQVAYYGDRYNVGISGFSFNIVNSMLGAPITIQSEARASEQSISLQKLVVATGRSMLKSSGMVSLQDSSSQLSFEATPIAWKDIAAIVDKTPIRQDVQAQLNLSGSPRRFNIGLDVQATGLDTLSMNIGLSYTSELVLKEAKFSAGRLNLPQIMADTTLPVLQNIQMQMDGEIPVNRYKESHFKGTMESGQITYGGYQVDELSGDFNLKENLLAVQLKMRSGTQHITTKGRARNIFDEEPQITISATGSRLNPGYWMKDPSYAGVINISAKVSGKGYYPPKTPWNYTIEVKNSEWFKQPVALARFEGKLSEQAITNNSLIRLEKSEVHIDADVRELTAIPKFSYTISTKGFDVSECREMDEFHSSISANIEGRGQGNSIQNLRLNSTVRLDSSIINGEFVSRLSATISIADTVATIQNAKLNSTIADGSFDAKLHLTDPYRTTNNLNLSAEIKDLSSLAPLVGTNTLLAKGTLMGELSPIYEDNLKFSGRVNLSDINYDNSLTATGASGSIDAFITEQPEYVIDINLSSPSFSSLDLQDVNIQTRGKVQPENIDGNFELLFNSPTEGRINHKGTYSVTKDSSVITTDQLQLISSLRTLSLQKPFTVLLKNSTIRMDTMFLNSDDGASLKLAIPYADSVHQQAYLSGQNLDLTVLQNALLSESYIEGVMSGSLQIDRADTLIKAKGDLEISNIIYRETVLDKFALKATIGEGVLTAAIVITDEGKEILTSEAKVPFSMEKPETIDDEFFEKPVEGFLRVNQVALKDFDKLLQGAGITETEGVLTIDGQLKGKAGAPEISGKLKMQQAILSGVQVDSVTASLDYNHQKSELRLNAAVNSLKQKAADVRAKIPFYINLLTFEMGAPQKTDSIFVDVITNKFNLAALNDFVDPMVIRDTNGRLNGSVRIAGPAGNLTTDGSLKLSGGSLRIIPAGIKIGKVSSTILFEPDRINITQFKAEGGSGTLTAKGTLALQELVPGEMDISITAKSFRAANTSEYNAVVNANAAIGGTFTRPDISGQLSFLSGFVELRNFGEKSVENIRLDSTEAQDQSSAIYDSLSMDMDISFNRRFFVRNKRYLEMEVELQGQVDLQKKAQQDLQIFGSISAASGYARPLGKRFEIEEGEITFLGAPDNPSVNVRSVYEPPQPEEDIKIWYIIEGTVEKPKFKYESQPEMELESIISYTLFGQPFYKLDSWQQVVANSGSNNTAADLAMEVLLDRVESLATRRLGIDVVKIDNTTTGGQNGTSITTGWYINPKVFFAIQNVITGSTPDTGFLLEYSLRKNLKLILSQGNDSRQGIDLKWNHDY